MIAMRVMPIVLCLLALPAAAEFSATITGVSDYDFRGVSQSAEDAALQGSIDFEHESGLYAGIWGSQIDFGDCCDEDIELDYYAGFYGEVREGFEYDVGLIYYDFPGTNTDLDYAEIYFGGIWNQFDAKLWYTNDFFAIDESAYYLEGNYSFDLPHEFGVRLHLGYTDGDALDSDFADDTGLESYLDYSIALSRAFGRFEASLMYVDTDLSGDFEVEHDEFANDGRVIFSLSTTFPWSDEDE